MVLETYLMGLALAILNFLSPVHHPRVVLPGWDETSSQRADRYLDIANDVSVVANEMCDGHKACAVSTVYMVLGIAWHESGFAPDVDLGNCYRGVDGRGRRCDGGRSHSMWQLQCMNGSQTCEEGRVFDTDRRAAIHEAIRRMWRSLKACSFSRNEERFAVYAGGGCKLPSAVEKSWELTAFIKKARQTPLDDVVDLSR